MYGGEGWGRKERETQADSKLSTVPRGTGSHKPRSPPEQKPRIGHLTDGTTQVANDTYFIKCYWPPLENAKRPSHLL